MNRTERLYAIREELRRSGDTGCTAIVLADRFAVSVRTIKRDIHSLQLGGFPVWAVPGPGGGYVVDEQATLPPIHLTPSEISGLCVAIASQSGLPYHLQAQAALSKILAVTSPQQQIRAQRLADRVWINHEEPTNAVLNLEIQRRIEDALADNRTLSICYKDSEGHSSQRRVDPQLLGYTRNTWYLVAFCHMRQAMRWFRLDRIISAHLTSQTSLDRPIAQIGAPPDTAHPVWQ
jgi:predicted DNA-binding transcriptional regulator YafY